MFGMKHLIIHDRSQKLFVCFRSFGVLLLLLKKGWSRKGWKIPDQIQVSEEASTIEYYCFAVGMYSTISPLWSLVHLSIVYTWPIDDPQV